MVLRKHRTANERFVHYFKFQDCIFYHRYRGCSGDNFPGRCGQTFSVTALPWHMALVGALGKTQLFFEPGNLLQRLVPRFHNCVIFFE
jgi:hypothetical protein